MKIGLSLHNRLSYAGGGEIFMVTLGKFMVERGHSVKIYSLPVNQDGNTTNSKIELGGVQYEETWSHCDGGEDICFAVYTPITHYYLKCDCPKISSLLSHHLLFGRLTPKEGIIPNTAFIVDRFVRNHELSHYEAIHTNNTVSFKLINHQRKYMLPNPIDPIFNNTASSKSDKFTVFFAGRHAYWKGWDIIVEVNRRLNETGRNKHVTLLSNGENQEGVKSISLRDPRALAAQYGAAQVVVYPSRGDTFGNVIVEAAMNGTPVITSSIEVHKSLGLPLLYADTASEIISQIDDIYYQWSCSKDKYYNYCQDLKAAAQKYALNLIGPQYESMFKEVESV